MRKEKGMSSKKSALVRVFGLLLVLAIAPSLSPAVAADDAYPSKPVRFIIPYSPGGSTDILGRIFADELSKSLGQQFVVDNRGGGGSIIGTEIASKCDPDGYSILFCGSSFTTGDNSGTAKTCS